jgi:hypothetical protein
MEARFNYDFGRVRIHTDRRAAAFSRALGAQAYTIGPDIVFGAGQYDPATAIGRRLLAHELAHVVQQQHARPGRLDRLHVSRPGSLEEQQAEAAGRVVEQAEAAGSSAAAGLSPTAAMIARVPDPNGGAPVGLSTTIVRAKDEQEAAAVIWYQGEIIVALLDIINNDYLDQYLSGKVTAAELIKAGNAIWAVRGEVMISTNVELKTPASAGGAAEPTAQPPDTPLPGGRQPSAQQAAPPRVGKAQQDKPAPGGVPPAGAKTGGLQAQVDQSAYLQALARLDALPANIQTLLPLKKTRQNLPPHMCDQMLRIAEKLKQLDPEDLRLFLLVADSVNNDLSVFERSIDEFIRFKDQVRAELEQAAKDRQAAASKEPSLEAKLAKTWDSFDEKGFRRLSRSQKEATARRIAAEQARIQLEHMATHPGETLKGMAEGIYRVDKVGKGILEDIKEAANGKKGGFARWAGVFGASSKTIGWLAGVAGVLYIAMLFVPGVNVAALATAALAGGVAAIALSSVEAELRIQAAAEAKNPEEFKTETGKSAAAASNVVAGLALMALGGLLKLTARIRLPGRLQNVGTALAMARSALVEKGVAGFKAIREQVIRRLRADKAGLPEALAEGKQAFGELKNKVEAMSGEELVDRLAKGDPELEEITGIDSEGGKQLQEIAKTPEGKNVPAEVRQGLIQALEDAPGQAELQANRFSSAVDDAIAALEKAEGELAIKAALDDAEARLNPKQMGEAAQADLESYTKQRLEAEAAKAKAAVAEAEAARTAEAGRWQDPKLGEAEHWKLYQEAIKGKPMTRSQHQARFKAGWRYDPSANPRGGQWKKPFKKTEPKPRKPISGDDEQAAVREAAEHMERIQIDDWASDLGPDWTVFRNRGFPRWLRRLFPREGQGPDMMAVNPKTRRILVGDVTTKPSAEHLAKTQADTTAVSRNLPDEYRGYKVVGREKYWEYAETPEEVLPLDEIRRLERMARELGDEPIDPEIFREEEFGDPSLDVPEYSPDIPPETE